MPNTYKRKTTQQSWSESSMAQAIAACQEGMSIQASAKLFKVPSTTLFRRLKMSPRKQLKKKLGRYRDVFTVEQEIELKNYLLKMEERLFGLTPSDFRRLAFQYAELNHVEHRFNTATKLAGKVWLRGFLTRHSDLSLRLPEMTSAARASAFNAVNVGKFFDLLQQLYDKNNYKPNNIYNCDETGISTVPNRPSKVIARKGKKQVGALSSAERGTLTTAEICFNAAGEYVPPALIFPRVRHHVTFDKGVPPNTKIFTHPSGWMQTAIFTEWFKHFLKYSKPTSEERVLLILDGHSTHIKNLEVIELARKSFVDILVLPPHCTHRLQPLDVAFMFPLSTYYEQAVRNWLRENPGKIVTIHEVGALFGEAYVKAASMVNALSGFRKTGIWPLERPDPSLFVAAATTDRPEPLLEPSTLTPAPRETVAATVTPEDIMPIPVMPVTSSGPAKRARAGTTAIATSSPFIQSLKESKKTRAPPPPKAIRRQLFDSESEENDDAISLYNDTDSGSEMNSPTSIRSINVQDLKEGTYVAVNYGCEIFPGLIISKTNDTLQVKCMERTQKYFKWPVKEDILEYNVSDIVMQIKAPKQMRRGFYNVPELCLYHYGKFF